MALVGVEVSAKSAGLVKAPAELDARRKRANAQDVAHIECRIALDLRLISRPLSCSVLLRGKECTYLEIGLRPCLSLSDLVQIIAAVSIERNASGGGNVTRER
jgi:hypothetical protein